MEIERVMKGEMEVVEEEDGAAITVVAPSSSPLEREEDLELVVEE